MSVLEPPSFYVRVSIGSMFGVRIHNDALRGQIPFWPAGITIILELYNYRVLFRDVLFL